MKLLKIAQSGHTAQELHYVRLIRFLHFPLLRHQDKIASVKAHLHYCVFRVRLRQTVALLRRDRKIPISALMQSTAESADRCG